MMRLEWVPPRVHLIERGRVAASWHNVVFALWDRAVDVEALTASLGSVPMCYEPPPEGIGLVLVVVGKQGVGDDPEALAVLGEIAGSQGDVHGVAIITRGPVPYELADHPGIGFFGSLDRAAQWLSPRLRAAGSLPFMADSLIGALGMLIPEQ